MVPWYPWYVGYGNVLCNNQQSSINGCDISTFPSPIIQIYRAIYMLYPHLLWMEDNYDGKYYGVTILVGFNGKYE